MDDVSNKIAVADEGGAVAPCRQLGCENCAIDCTNGETEREARVPVTREEIAILRAFLSAEIDAIIYGDNPMSKD